MKGEQKKLVLFIYLVLCAVTYDMFFQKYIRRRIVVPIYRLTKLYHKVK